MTVHEAIESRRAYRSLEKTEITPELIDKLASAAGLAPSCANKQPWRFVFVTGAEAQGKIRTALEKGNEWALAASLYIAVVSRKDLDCVIREREYFLFDTGMAVAFILLQATELGLVAHPIAGFNEEKAKQALEIPDDMRMITLINVGKHAAEINPVLSENMKLGEKQRPPRIPKSDYVFIDRFGKS